MKIDLLSSIRQSIPDFVPVEDDKVVLFYTFRYIFAEKLENGETSHRYTLITAPWSGHLLQCQNIFDDDKILSCLVEYVGEYDARMTALVFPIKNFEEE